MKRTTNAVDEFLTRLCCLIPRRAVPAERYLAIGETVGFGLRQGFAIENIARGLQMTMSECLLAREFSESSTNLKFRALVEHWSWRQILTAMICDQVFDSDDWSPVDTGPSDPYLPDSILQSRRLPSSLPS